MLRGINKKDMAEKLTKQDEADIRRALIIAMKTLDEDGGVHDKALSDRLEIINEKLADE